MWNPATITALSAAVVAVIGAVGGLIRLGQHKTSPSAHGGQGHQPASFPRPTRPPAGP